MLFVGAAQAATGVASTVAACAAPTNQSIRRILAPRPDSFASMFS